MEVEQRRTRMRYGAELNARILSECEATDASVAKVAMSNGINANIVHGWRKLARDGTAAIDGMQREFVPVAVAPAPDVRARDELIGIGLRRGTLTMMLVAPSAAFTIRGVVKRLALWSRPESSMRWRSRRLEAANLESARAHLIRVQYHYGY